MGTTPKENIDRINQVTTAWETLRPDKSFGGMTLAQFKEKVKPSLEARAALAALDSQVTEAQNRRDDADAVSTGAVSLVVNAVRGDPAEGDDGALYEAMGYVRRSEQRSGLHRALAQPKPQP